MTPGELRAAVERAIGILSNEYRTAATESDLYEAALLACAVDAAERAGGIATLMSNGVPLVGPITFRTSPGNLANAAFTYVHVDFPQSGRALEIHLGIRVVGASGVAHESDVAIIDADECDRSRALGAHPRRTKVIGSLEAKHYAASPGIGVGRAFLGLSGELGGAKCFLVFPAEASSNLATLIARKDPECLSLVTPGSPAAGRLASLIEQRIRNWLP